MLPLVIPLLLAPEPPRVSSQLPAWKSSLATVGTRANAATTNKAFRNINTSFFLGEYPSKLTGLSRFAIWVRGILPLMACCPGPLRRPVRRISKFASDRFGWVAPWLERRGWFPLPSHRAGGTPADTIQMTQERWLTVFRRTDWGHQNSLALIIDDRRDAPTADLAGW